MKKVCVLPWFSGAIYYYVQVQRILAPGWVPNKNLTVNYLIMNNLLFLKNIYSDPTPLRKAVYSEERIR